MPQRTIAAAVPEPDGIGADVADLAVLDRHVPGGVGHDRGLDLRGGLHGLETAPRREPLAVAEGEPAKGDVLDEPARRRHRRRSRGTSRPPGRRPRPWPCLRPAAACSTASRRGPGTIRRANPRRRDSFPGCSANWASRGSTASSPRRWSSTGRASRRCCRGTAACCPSCDRRPDSRRGDRPPGRSLANACRASSGRMRTVCRPSAACCRAVWRPDRAASRGRPACRRRTCSACGPAWPGCR